MSTEAKADEQPEVLTEYLSLAPVGLQAATDLALVVNQRKIHVHSFLLVCQSAVLREAILGCGLEKPERAKSLLPLLGDDLTVIQDALKYLYRRTFAPQPIQFASRLEAVRVATFAHKYNCGNLTHEADTFLAAESVKTSTPVLLAKPDSKRVAQTSDLQHAAWDVLDYTAFAQDMGLARLLCHCTHWLVSNRQVIRNATERIANFGTPTLAALTRALATDIPSSTSGCRHCGNYQVQQPVSGWLTPLPTILGWHGLT